MDQHKTPEGSSTPYERRMGHCVACEEALTAGARWCPGCGAAVLASPPGQQEPRWLVIVGIIFGGLAGFVAIVALLTYLWNLDQQKLPVSEDFSGECTWPVGS